MIWPGSFSLKFISVIKACFKHNKFDYQRKPSSFFKLWEEVWLKCYELESVIHEPFLLWNLVIVDADVMSFNG